MKTVMRNVGVLLALGTFVASAADAQVSTPSAPVPSAQAAPSTDATPIPTTATDISAAPMAGGQAVASTQCELHVWPAERFVAHTSGWLSGMGPVGALVDASAHANKDKSNRTQVASALDSPGQLAALTQLELPRLLALQPAQVITHVQPLERHTMNSIKTRRAESNSPCYSELIVGDILYQKAALYGRSLKALFMLRDFGAGSKIKREYKSWGGNGLKLFPPKEGEDVQAANDELVSVFKDDFDEFARSASASAAGTN